MDNDTRHEQWVLRAYRTYEDPWRPHPDKVRTVFGTQHEGRLLREAYERELNDGRLWADCVRGLSPDEAAPFWQVSGWLASAMPAID